ncbi:dihydrofolate reductase [Sphingomonas abietis]|uniref:Dihydrofolate reductase n=1 Tax=Sphingomonas abietis TaxID=3012344 RepID=A0ABY7NP36_9SPHN|nr:dihydrofolate reductase [Sphingomonas abietis]WBO23133.1 dihydrofolate reductase [Sphingomonas abietis]
MAIDGPEVALYVARADNGVIGVDGGLPWRLPEDLKRFKDSTMGKPMVMGRKTFESFPSPLPGRRHIVLTRDAGWQADGAEVAHDIDGAIALAGRVPEIAVIGGAEIYRLFLPRAHRIELTEVHRSPEGDTKMPPLGEGWRISNRIFGGPDFDFVTLVRD